MITAKDNRGQKAVARWIYIGVIMLLIQVILGGITRLTGSGLSITEWQVLTGTFPPLNDASWMVEFDKYKQTPQYQILNADFTLSDFKFIFFWEWFHRFWARMIGVVFLVGFVYLLAKKYLRKDMVYPLLILFLLGALQGAVGWIMVMSGLTGDEVYVKPAKLAIHFVLALVLISYSWWFALQLSVPRHDIIRSKILRTWIWPLFIVLLFQLGYGALMAGHKAASAAPTWPDINGGWVPEGIFSDAKNMVENKVAVHFIHRNLAYLLMLITVIWTFFAFRTSSASRSFRKARIYPMLLIVLQALLGILAVLESPEIVPARWAAFEWLAELHQVVGMLFLLSAVTVFYLSGRTGRNAD
ncbi:MAG: COX15/CtaA family protein [Gemmatimonadaceae bacterium]|nr:COX15/CtaA family protein [Chitinophagaceae bacterium]